MSADKCIAGSKLPFPNWRKPVAKSCSDSGFKDKHNSWHAPCLCLICWEVPTVRSLPSAMMPNLVDKASASSMEWVVKRTAEGAAAGARPTPGKAVAPATALNTAPQRARRAAGSRPQLGSSSTASVGLPTSARAADNFRLFPPLSKSARRCAIFSSLKLTKASSTVSLDKPFKKTNNSK